MSETFRIVVTIAQMLYTLWPLLLVVIIAYSVWGVPLRSIPRKIKNNLLVTWVVLFVIWLLTLFAEGPNLTLFPEPYNSIAFLGGFALLAAITWLPKLKPGRLFRELGDLLAGRAQARLSMRQMRALEDIKKLDPYHFEELVAELYRAEGYTVRRVGQSGDHGVDVQVFTPRGEHWIVQCKRYRDSVGEETVRELYGTLHHEGAQRAILVTSAETTLAAETWARGKPIDLIDGPTLLRWIERVNANSQPTLLDRVAAALQAFFHPRVSFEGRVQVAQNGQASRRPAPATPSTSRNGSRGYQNGKVQPNTVDTQPAILRPIERQVVQITSQPLDTPPVCPRCHVPMVPRPPQANDRPGRLLFRCRNYPHCRVVLEGQKNPV